jgi:hypothetical protein
MGIVAHYYGMKTGDLFGLLGPTSEISINHVHASIKMLIVRVASLMARDRKPKSTKFKCVELFEIYNQLSKFLTVKAFNSCHDRS